MLYVLDRAGLTEHGGNVGGGWITPLGTDFLAFLDACAEVSEDEIANVIEDAYYAQPPTRPKISVSIHDENPTIPSVKT